MKILTEGEDSETFPLCPVVLRLLQAQVHYSILLQKQRAQCPHEYRDTAK